MQRRPTTQDITWLLDLNRNGQLNLDPPYQRRSVWTLKDRQFFLDTIFRNYPSPAIFLHKTISETGQATYHVVDGKQRTETILEFVQDKLRLSKDYGDTRLDGKKWSDLQGETELKTKFWNYQITVELIDVVDGSLVNEVFDRLNRNSRRLTNQELRHAKFEGWLITEAEAEANREEWQAFGIVTRARMRRMADVQFVSELMLVLLERSVLGFDQDRIDAFYAKYDDPQDSVPGFDEDHYRTSMDRCREYLQRMDLHNQAVSKYARALANFYTLWCLVALNEELPDPVHLAEDYAEFMERVETLNSQEDLSGFLQNDSAGTYTLPFTYLDNFRGANTDISPREKRYQALKSALLG